MTINREGINVITLNSTDKRSVTDKSGQEQMIHSLGSTNYLKLESSNFILFEWAGDIKVVSVMQEYQTGNAIKNGIP